MQHRTDPHGNQLPARLHFKDGGYYHVRRVAGRVRWRHVGHSYPEALREWARLEGGGVAARTVAQALEAYLVERGPELASATRRGYESSRGRILAVFGHQFLEDVRRPEIRAWLHARSAGTSANRDLALLRAALGHAVEIGTLTENPARGVRRRPERPRRRVASLEELEALRAAAAPLWRALLALELLTGMRQGEIRELRRSDLADDGIRLIRPKTGAGSLILWSPALLEAVEAACKAARVPSLYLFPSRKGGPYSEHGFRTAWRRLTARAGVEGLQFRDLRRTAASEAENLEAARALLGHASIGITRRVYVPLEKVRPTR